MLRKLATALTALAALGVASLAHAWEPTKTVEFIVPAGTGGGADQMARAIQGIIDDSKRGDWETALKAVFALIEAQRPTAEDIARVRARKLTKQ